MLYSIIGNDVSFPEGTNPRSPYKDPQKDRLLPDPHDAGHDDRVGYVLRTDPEGTDWVVLCGGLRNQFDAAFNADGELFTWDSDMEWDVGMPWYRPTRVNHIVSGGEYGWRWGTGNWPAYYADSLPSNLDTALGSPTGMAFGYGSNFPPKFRERLFMADWQHGKILSATLTPEGATYRAEAEVFVEGGPLNVCDLQFGTDGALYFITGGRGSQSGLYRVTFTGQKEAPDAPSAESAAELQRHTDAGTAARDRRKRLEAFHLPFPPEAIDDIWPSLGDEDRWIRSAARVALEHQPLEFWQDRIVGETDPLRRETAFLAWTRVAAPDARPAIQSALTNLPLPEADEPLGIRLRTWSILLARGPALAPELVAPLMARLAAHYPHDSLTINRDLCELLVYLQWPQIVSRTLPLIENAASQEDEIHAVHALIRYAGAWKAEQRLALLKWFQHARQFTGGHLLPEVLANMQQDFLDMFSEAERTELASAIAELQAPATIEAQPQRPLVQKWTLAELLPQLALSDGQHDAQRGRKLLTEAGCLKCHRWEQSGAAVGPELTSVGKRYSPQMIAESILEPSKVLDPKYAATQYLLRDGRVVIGRAAKVQAHEITVEINGLTQESVVIQRDAIEESQPSTVSPMPAGLLDTFTADEIREMLAFLSAGPRTPVAAAKPTAVAPPTGTEKTNGEGAEKKQNAPRKRRNQRKTL
ncbi:MAG: c-type cytochrome [Planctomycetaceae bacterium]